MSVVLFPPSGEALLEDIADIAESIDDVRGAPLPWAGLGAAEEVPIFARFRVSSPAGSFVVAT